MSPGPKPNDDYPLPQESDDQEDSGSQSSNVEMMAGQKQFSNAPVAQMDFRDVGNFHEFEPAMMMDPLNTSDFNLSHSPAPPMTNMPINAAFEQSLQGDFLDQNTAMTGDAFPLNYQWNDDPMTFSPTEMPSSSTESLMRDQGMKDSQTILTMYNVEAGTLNSMLETAFRSKTKIRMETYH